MFCKETPNGWRYAPAYFARVLVGRDHATLPEPTSRHANCLTARRACARFAATNVAVTTSGARRRLAPQQRALRGIVGQPLAYQNAGGSKLIVLDRSDMTTLQNARLTKSMEPPPLN